MASTALPNPFCSESVYLILHMKSLRSILSLAFAFLVLFSSTSFMVGIHRCGGQVQSLALFSKAAGCEKEQKLPPCHRHESPPCCQDITVIHEHQDFKGEITQFDLSASLVVEMVQPFVVLDEVIPTATKFAYCPHYDPPLRSSDLTVSLQVFLI